MNVQDFIEALTRCALEEAGWVVDAWDERPADFPFEIDFLCRQPRPLLVLVNNSDSFFASQKKFWRNVEEPFESAMVFGKRSLVANVSFVTAVARSAPLYRIAQQFFDRTFSADFTNTKDTRLVAIADMARPIRSPKKESINTVRSRIGDDPKVKQLYKGLVEFFRQTHSAKPNSDLPRDVTLYRQFPECRVHFGENVHLRRQTSALLVLGADLLEWMRKQTGSDALSLTVRPSGRRDMRLVERLSRMAHLHNFAVVQRSIVGYVVSEMAPELHELLVLPEDSLQHLIAVSERMVQAHPTIRDYVEGASDYGGAKRMAQHVIALLEAPSVSSLSRALLQCSTDDRYGGEISSRNWVLEFLLQASALSQTYVQQRCSIQRLTHAVTGEITLTNATAREIAEILLPPLAKTKVDIEGLTTLFMRQRKYNLDTHSYANPLYVLIRESLEKFKPPTHELLGYPDTNGAVASAWHTECVSDPGSAGQIRVQFLLQPRDPNFRGKKCIIKVISAHEGHAADKRKELAAKGRILRFSKSTEGFSVQSDLFLGLVLDGDWRLSGTSMSSALDMVAASGWSGIYDSATIETLNSDLRSFFRGVESSPTVTKSV